MRPTDRLGGLKVVEGKNPSLGETIDIEKVRNAYIDVYKRQELELPPIARTKG